MRAESDLTLPEILQNSFGRDFNSDFMSQFNEFVRPEFLLTVSNPRSLKEFLTPESMKVERVGIYETQM